MQPINLEDHVAHLIRRVQQLHSNLWISQVSVAVTSPQFAVLNSLAVSPGADQKTIAKLAALDRSTVADVVLRLVKRGYVTKRKDPIDGRRTILHLTPEGEALLQPLIESARLMSENLLGPLTSGGREQLRRLLATILSHHRTTE